MSTIQNSSSLSQVNAAQTAASGKSAAKETEDRFLQLLVTQMKNQDPLNPMDNAEITSQMAQLSTVEGIDKLNGTAQSLSSSLLASQTVQAASLVGHGVLAPGSALELANGAALGGVELTQDADTVLVTLKDASGQVVDKMDLGPQPAGTATFRWEGAGGKTADGVYAFEVSATQGGKPVAANPLTFGQVGSVSLGSQGIMLNLNGLGAVALSDVRQII